MTRTHLTGEPRTQARTEAARLYHAGGTIQGIARQLGRSYSLTRTLLLEAGVQPRRRGNRARYKAAR